MQVFRTALKLVFRFPAYLLLYLVFFGFLGVIIVASYSTDYFAGSTPDTPEAVRPVVAVIDRDHSELSEGLVAYLASRGDYLELPDSTRALQDASAQGRTGYIVVIPAGYGERFVAAARANTPAPALQTIVNYQANGALYMDTVTGEYLSALRIAALGWRDAPVSELLAHATQTADEHAAAHALPTSVRTGNHDLIVFYFQWISYPVTTSLIVLVALIFGAFQSGELRRRNLSAPLSPTRMNTQVAFACLSLVVMAWAFLIALSFLPVTGGPEYFADNPQAFLLIVLAAFVYALVPFSIGFLLSQLGLKEMLSNGLANIISLAFCFVSGTFMGSVDMLSEGVQTLAHFTPTYWYSTAVHAFDKGVLSADALAGFWSSLGVVALFAVAFFCLALLAGNLRARTADAGGNTAAATPAR